MRAETSSSVKSMPERNDAPVAWATPSNEVAYEPSGRRSKAITASSTATGPGSESDTACIAVRTRGGRNAASASPKFHPRKAISRRPRSMRSAVAPSSWPASQKLPPGVRPKS